MSTALEQLKQERERQRQEEHLQLEERRREAEMPAYKHAIKWVITHPKRTGTVIGGVVLAFVLLRLIVFGYTYLDARSQLSNYYELSEAGQLEEAQKALAGYLDSNREDWAHQVEFGVLLARLGKLERAERVLGTASSSPEGKSADVQYYYALSQIKSEGKMIAGMDSVLAGLTNYLPALVVRAAASHRQPDEEGLGFYEQAVARVAELDPASEIYMRSQRQVNDFLDLACRHNTGIFEHTFPDPSTIAQEDVEDPKLFDFAFPQLDAQQQYIYGIDNSLFLNFCGLTVARGTERGEPADLRAIVHMLHAYALAKAGNLEEATAAAARSKEFGILPEVGFLDATVAALAGNYDDAVAKLEDAAGYTDAPLMVTAGHAMVHSDPASWPKAKELFARALAVGNEASAVAFNNRGVLLLIENLPGQARNDFGKAAELNSVHPHAIYNKGISYVLEGKYEEALKNFSVLFGTRNIFPGLRYYAALCYHHLGRSYQAQTELRYAIDDTYFSGYAYTLLGDIFSDQQLFAQKATDSYRRAHELLPSSYAVGFKLAQSLSRNGQPVAASKLIDTIVEESGDRHANDDQYKLLLDATRGEVYFALNDPAALGYLKNSYDTAQDPVLKAQLAVTYANLLIEDDQAEEAVEITREQLSVAADNIAILVARARALLATDEVDQAANTIRGAISKAAENYAVQMAAGKIFAAGNEVEEALSAYRAAHNLEPANVAPLDKQLALLKEHSPDDIRIVRLQEEIDNATLLAASTAPEERTVEGQAVVPGAIIQDPEAVAAAEEQIVKLSADLEEGAIDKFTGYQNLAGLKIQIGDFSGALDDMQRASSIDPKAITPLKNIGRLNVFLSRFGPAGEAYLKAVALSPDDSALHYALGLVRRRFPNKELAVGDFTRVIELDPANVGAYLARGDLLSILERYDEAIADFSRVIRLDDRNLCAYEGRRTAYVLSGERDKANKEGEIINVLREDQAPTACF